MPPPPPPPAPAPAPEKKKGVAPGLSLSPDTPQVGGRVTSPAEPPPVVAPEPSAEWKFEVTGYFRAPLRMSWGPSTTSPGVDVNGNDIPASEAGTQFRTPPLVPDANYIDWRYTNSLVAPWTELNFKYGNDRVKAQVQIASYNLTDPGYRRLESNLGINQAFITLLWPELANIENLHLTLTVGGFTNRYGAAGRYDAGKYETYLFGRTHVAGATVNVAYDATDDWTFQIEGGGGAKLEPIPYYGAPGPEQRSRRTPLPMWEPYPGPRPQESAFLAHVHLGAVYKRQWIAGRCTSSTCSPTTTSGRRRSRSRRSTPLRARRRPRRRRRCAAVHTTRRARASWSTARTSSSCTRGSATATSASRVVDARNAIYLGDAIEVLHSFGGWQLHDNYFGAPGSTDLVTGKIYSALAQYSLSIGQLLWHPQAFWGQGPDLILNVFGMYNYVDLDVAAGANPIYDGIKKLKFGAEMTYLPLDWFGVGFRGDVVQPNLDDSEHELLGLLAAADLPHRVRDARADHDPVLALLRRGRRPRACSRTTSSRAPAGSWAPTRMRRRSPRSSGSKRQDTRTTMKTQAKLLVGTLSMGLLALGGCIKPPPGSGQGPAPGSAASIGGGATAAQARWPGRAGRRLRRLRRRPRWRARRSATPASRSARPRA